MSLSVLFDRVGGPEVMYLKDVDVGEPGPGQVRVKNRAIGLNYIDTYHRSGLYPLPLPSGLGLEAAGIVDAVGQGVALAVGDAVAYCAAGIGAYGEMVVLPAGRVVALPAGVDCDTAAAVLLKGATVEYLVQRLHTLKAGETTLFHAAAGGVGLLFGQWAKALGATAIGTVSTEAKRELALANGYDHCFISGKDDIVAEVRAITDGQMLPVVYDGVGATTFETSLDCLAPRGLMVSFGNASGSPPPFDLQQLSARGSLFITRPSLMAYVASDAEMQDSAACVFDQIQSGVLKVNVAQRFPLVEVQRAHVELEARRTVASSLLIP